MQTETDPKTTTAASTPTSSQPPAFDPEAVLQAAAEQAKKIAEEKPVDTAAPKRRDPREVLLRMAEEARKNPPQLPAEPLGKSMHTILAKSGYMTPERREQIEAAQRRQQDVDRQQRAGRLREAAGVPKLYWSADLSDISFIQQNIPEALEEYTAARDDLADLIDHPGTVVLRGENGPGKTHLASALVHRFCDHGRTARYTTAMDFFVEVQSTFNEPGRTKADLLQRYKNYELLVIDEYEVRSDTNWENIMLRSLIDSRYAGMVATVMITNLSLEELRDYLPRAIRDRIRESGVVIECNWRSLRAFRRNEQATPAPVRPPRPVVYGEV